ncbi:MAG: hypothetical protein M1832_004484 [Thelocarpon impressellum]|nr:MAG: hypothetical protein M1832_004484 [Thelocarpon impressellum]
MAATGPPPSTESHRLGDAAPSGGTPSHKRVYQACIPCRRRKVRCDLGSVDEPHDPPCQRCRRESKECYFSATRRKRRPADGGEGEFEDEIDDDYGARNARKRLRRSSERDDRLPPDITIPRHTSSTSTPATPSGLYRAGSAGNAPQPLTPGGSRGQAQPLRRPNSDTHSSLSPRQPYSAGLPRKQSHAANASGSSPARAEAADDDQHLTNRLWEAEVYSGHDALNLLFEAAGRTGDIGRHRPETHGSANHSPVAVNATPGRPTTSSANDVGRRTIGGGKADNMGPPSSRPRPEILLVDPAIRGQDPGYESRSIGRDDEGLQDALKAWSRLRFVRAGWFTAREAMDYID